MDILKKYCKKNIAIFIIIVLLLISTSLITIPLPYFSKLIIDDVLLNQQFSKMKNIILLFVSILIIQVILGRTTAKIISKFCLDLSMELKLNVFINNFKFQKNSSQISKIQTIILNDIDILTNNYMQIILTFFSNITSLLGYLVVLLIISPSLTLVVLVFIPIYVIWLNFISKKLKILNLKSQESKEALLHESNETFGNYLSINIYGLINTAQKNFKLKVSENIAVTKKIYIYNNFVSIVSKIILTSAAFIPLFMGMNLVKNQSISIGELIAFNSYCGVLFGPITSIVQLLPVFKTTQVYEQRIRASLEESIPENAQPKYLQYLPDNNGLELKDINISVNNRILIEDLNLSVKPGEIIQLTGDNGTGKSLLLKSIVQLYPNYSGLFYFNGELLNKKNLAELSSDIIYLSGDQGFYMDNLKNNLINNDPSIQQSYILEVLKLVGLEEKISSLESGLETSKLTLEKKFSLGELQKLRLARALLKKPKVLLMDEIMSNISQDHSIEILTNINIKYPKMTIILVEHHLDCGNLLNFKWNISKKHLTSYEIV